MIHSSFRAGMGQILVEPGQPQANLNRSGAMIGRAAAEGCRLVVLPECLDFGWGDPSAVDAAEPIPGPHTERLQQCARAANIYVAAGLVERAGDRLYNAAVLIAPDGAILLHHRKINELDICQGLYSVGDRLGVVETELGVFGLNICADNFGNSLAIGHVLCRMGAQVILSPSAWAVPADHDNTVQPYGELWMCSYSELAKLYDVSVIGVSNVGWIINGAWQGRKVIGCSLAVGPGGEVLAKAPYGEDAESLTVVEVEPKPAIAGGTKIGDILKQKGYIGP